MDEWIKANIHTVEYYLTFKYRTFRPAQWTAQNISTITESSIAQHWYRCYTIYYMTQWWKEGFLEHWDLHVIHSVQFSSLWPREPQHARPPCRSPTPKVYPNSCPLSRWCHPVISISVVPFSSCPQSFPASGFFQMSHLFASGGQSKSFSFNISPSNEHPGLISFKMDWLDLLAVQGTLKSLLQHHSSNASILWHSAFFIVQLSHPYMTTGKMWYINLCDT